MSLKFENVVPEGLILLFLCYIHVKKFTAARAGTSTVSGIFCFVRVRAARNKRMVPCHAQRSFGRFLGNPTQTDCGSCNVDPKSHYPENWSVAMCEHAGVLGDFGLVSHRDICREYGLIGRRNYFMTEAANSLSAAAGPELSKLGIVSPIFSFGLGHGRTRLGSGLRAIAPRCISRENAGSTTTVLHRALCGDDFDQTPVSIIFRETV